MGGRTTAERTVHSTRGSRTWRRSNHVRTFPPHTNQSHGNHPGASGVDHPRGSSQQRKDQSIRHEYSFIGRSRSIRAFSGGTRAARSDRPGEPRVLVSAEKRPMPSRKYKLISDDSSAFIALDGRIGRSVESTRLQNCRERRRWILLRVLHT